MQKHRYPSQTDLGSINEYKMIGGLFGRLFYAGIADELCRSFLTNGYEPFIDHRNKESFTVPDSRPSRIPRHIAEPIVGRRVFLYTAEIRGLTLDLFEALFVVRVALCRD